MGKLQRTRGAAYEREVCDVLTKKAGRKISRELGQARDGGADIKFGQFLIECKRRRKIALYEWVRQVQVAAKDTDSIWAVVARADGERSVVILDLEDFLALLPDEDEHPQDPLAARLLAGPKPARSVAARGRSRTHKVGRVAAAIRKEQGLLTGTGPGHDERLQCQSALGPQTAAMGGLGRLRPSALVATFSEGSVATIRRTVKP